METTGGDRGEGNSGLPPPPGFRFRPDNYELMTYLREKLQDWPVSCGETIKEVDVYSCHPRIIIDRYSHPGDQGCYVFSSTKLLSGGKVDRSNGSGKWKATGGEKEVYCIDGEGKKVVLGHKSSMTYVDGNGVKTHWLMDEYLIKEFRGCDNTVGNSSSRCKRKRVGRPGEVMDRWVICYVHPSPVKSSYRKRVVDQQQQQPHVSSPSTSYEFPDSRLDNGPVGCTDLSLRQEEPPQQLQSMPLLLDQTLEVVPVPHLVSYPLPDSCFGQSHDGFMDSLLREDEPLQQQLLLLQPVSPPLLDQTPCTLDSEDPSLFQTVSPSLETYVIPDSRLDGGSVGITDSLPREDEPLQQQQQPSVSPPLLDQTPSTLDSEDPSMYVTLSPLRSFHISDSWLGGDHVESTDFSSGQEELPLEQQSMFLVSSGYQTPSVPDLVDPSLHETLPPLESQEISSYSFLGDGPVEPTDFLHGDEEDNTLVQQQPLSVLDPMMDASSPETVPPLESCKNLDSWLQKVDSWLDKLN